MAILSLIIMILFLGFALLALLHPFWGIIECAIAKDRGGVNKGVWLIIMLVTWSLGSLVYGLFATTSKTLRRATLLLILPTVILTVLSGIVLLRDTGARERFMRQMAQREPASTSGQQLPDVHDGANQS